MAWCWHIWSRVSAFPETKVIGKVKAYDGKMHELLMSFDPFICLKCGKKRFRPASLEKLGREIEE
jgi:hypothetical protein